jgi:hypothetical protein
MLQPTLLSYSFQGPPTPVLLDATSVRPDSILLLDTFFHVVVFHGETVAAWKAQGYHLQEEHANFRNLIETPLNDSQIIMNSRFPIPRYIVCDQHKSEGRFLLNILNPSVTHHSSDSSTGGQTIFTDDVSLRVFMEHLMKVCCHYLLFLSFISLAFGFCFSDFYFARSSLYSRNYGILMTMTSSQCLNKELQGELATTKLHF